MARQKYYYAIVDRDNGSLWKKGDADNEELPIYRSKKRAKEDLDFCATEFDSPKKYILQPINIEKLNKLIISHPNPKAR